MADFAIGLDGSSGYGTVSGIGSLYPYTIEALVRHTGASFSFFEDIITGNGAATNTLPLVLQSGKPRSATFTATNAIAADRWTHLAVTNTGTDLKIYQNGVVIKPAFYGGDIIPTHIGRYYDSAADYFKGDIDEIRFWSVVRSASEIFDNMAIQLTGAESNLVGYWKCNDGSGATAVDETTGSHDISLTGTTTWPLGFPFARASFAHPLLDHYTDAYFGSNIEGTWVSDGDTSDFIHRFTYIAVDLGSGNSQIVDRLGVHIWDASALSELQAGDFQGSNNSTDGTDGDWTTLTSLAGLTATSGWDALPFSNTTAYQWYRINGTSGSASTKLAEWQLLRDVTFTPPTLNLPVQLFTPEIEPRIFNVPVTAIPLASFAPVLNPLWVYPDTLAIGITNPLPTFAAEARPGSLSLPLALFPPPQPEVAYYPTTLALPLVVNAIAWTRDALSGLPTYQLSLTGDADATTDVVLPMASFNARMRDGEESYLQVVIPDADTWSADIAARPNGDIVVKRGVQFADGSTQLEEIARVNLEDIADDQGAKSQSISLTGHKQTTNAAPKSRTMTGLTYRHAGSGAKRYRCDLDTNLRAGDTAVIDEFSESITVGTIQYTVDTQREEMEISELVS